MRFILLVFLNEEVEARKNDAERAEKLRRCAALAAEWKRRRVMEAGVALHPTSVSTTVRVRGGKTILTDGPFAETSEQLGEYYIVDCANHDESLRLAAEAIEIQRNPTAAVEVRPILEFAAIETTAYPAGSFLT